MDSLFCFFFSVGRERHTLKKEKKKRDPTIRLNWGGISQLFKTIINPSRPIASHSFYPPPFFLGVQVKRSEGGKKKK